MAEDRAPAPLVTEAEAARLAWEVYGVRGQVRTLPGEYDHNFHIVPDAGPGFVLKVMHPARERALLDLQVAALSHLARRAADLGPRVRETRGGEALTVQDMAQGPPRLLWMVDYRPGSTLAEARPRSPELLESLGRLLGRLDAALADFEHRGAERVFKWDLSRAGWIAGALAQVEPAPRRALLERALASYEAEVVPALPHLRRSVIHGDANDHNVIVGPARPGPREVVALVDFGDMHRGLVSAEPAVAAAYALLGARDPLAAAARVVAGYHAAFPLREDEIARLWPLIVMRLAVSVTNSAASRRSRPGEAYLAVSEGPAWEALEKLDAVHPRFAHYTLRAACGLEAVPDAGPVREWLASQTARAAPVLDTDLRTAPCVVIDLGVASRFLGADPAAGATGPASVAINRRMDEAGARVAIGRYGEVRALYTSPLFGTGEPGGERRTVHLAIDLFAAAGTPVHAPLEGSVQVLGNNPASQDYGPLVILRHETPSGRAFFTLYGHLSEDTLEGLAVGRRVARGERIGRVGSPPTNGDWPPHVHFQIILDLLDETADYPGVARASERIVWMSLCPDPNLLLGIPAHRFPPPGPTPEETLAQRRAHLGGNLRLSYRRPLEIVRGFLQHLHDRDGRAYLDFFNNVPIVGHSHPRVVRAGDRAARAAQYQHALPPRADGALRRAPDRSPARTAAGLLLPELGQRGQRAGAPPGQGPHGPRRPGRARSRLSRQHQRDDRRQPLQVRGTGRPRLPALGARRRLARRLSRALSPRRRRCGRELRGGRGADRPGSGGRRARPRRLPGREPAQRGRADRASARVPVRGLRATSGPRAACASPTRCRRGSPVPESISGSSRRRAWCRTWSFSASPSATASPWLRS